jgi:hypothetical protein
MEKKPYYLENGSTFINQEEMICDYNQSKRQLEYFINHLKET